MIDVREYAKALFLLTEEAGTTDTVLANVELVKQIFSENPSYKNLLDTPALQKSEKLALVDEAFGGIDEYTRNLLKILCEKHAVYAFPKLADEYFSFVDDSRGIERVEAISAVPMTEAQIKALCEKLEAMTKKTIIIKNTVDKSIIGGMKLRYAGLQLDGSLKTKIERFEKTLRDVII